MLAIIAALAFGACGTSGKRVTVVSYNTLLRGGGPAWDQDDACRALAIGDRLAASSFDIVALQEAWDDDVDELLGKAGARFPYVASAEALDGSSGLVILSRFPLIDIRAEPYEAYYGDETWVSFSVRKGWLQATAVLPSGERLVVINTHLDAGDSGGSRRARRAQLRELATAAAASAEPTLLVGDFNVDGFGQTSQAAEPLSRVAKTLGAACGARDGCTVHDAFAQAHPNAAGHLSANTVNCASTDLDECERTDDIRHARARQRLDYIWVVAGRTDDGHRSVELAGRAIGTEPWQHTPTDSCPVEYLSDHKLLIGEFIVRQQ